MNKIFYFKNNKELCFIKCNRNEAEFCWIKYNKNPKDKAVYFKKFVPKERT